MNKYFPTRKAFSAPAKTVLFTSLVLLLSFTNSRQAYALSWVYQLQNANPSTLVQGSVSVIDYSSNGSDSGQYSQLQIQSMKEAGGTPISYLSIGEAESYRFYWNNTWVNDDTNNYTGSEPSWLGRTNPDWVGNYKVRYWDADWRDNYLSPYLHRVISQGFKGVYLDIVDGFEYWSNESVYSINGGSETRLASDPFGNENEAATRMLDLISWIKDYLQINGGGNDFKIIPQNGERLLDFDKTRYLSLIDGIGVEDLWYSETTLQATADVQERLNILNQITEAGLDVFSVDYVDGGGTEPLNIQRIKDFIALCEASDFHCYAAQTDRELDEANDYIERAGINPVPVPTAFWMFFSGFIALLGKKLSYTRFIG